MKKIWSQLHQHIQEDFSIGVYGFTVLFLAGSIYVNYTFNIEDGLVEVQPGEIKFLFYLLLYAVAYFTVLGIYSVFTKKLAYWKEKSFWIRSAVVLLVLSLDSSRPYLHAFVHSNFHTDLQYYAYKILVNLYSLAVVMVPLLVFYILVDKHEKHVYGLQPKNVDIRPYFILLLLMMPLIIGASFSPGFQAQYPMYKTSTAPALLNTPEWMLVGVYELVYGADFITVEFLFRGFLVIALMSNTGRSSVLTMAAVYCFLHFGKPMGEAISSIFGGYILGVIAYETRSIWGGILIHIGIAWSMEIMAFISK